MPEKKKPQGIGDSPNTKRLQMEPSVNGSAKLLYAMAGVMMIVIVAMGGAWAMYVNTQLSRIHNDINDFTESFVRKDELALILGAQADIASAEMSKMNRNAATNTLLFERIVKLLERKSLPRDE
jgi:hypothetical protein